MDIKALMGFGASIIRRDLGTTKEEGSSLGSGGPKGNLKQIG